MQSSSDLRNIRYRLQTEDEEEEEFHGMKSAASPSDGFDQTFISRDRRGQISCPHSGWTFRQNTSRNDWRCAAFMTAFHLPADAEK